MERRELMASITTDQVVIRGVLGKSFSEIARPFACVERHRRCSACLNVNGRLDGFSTDRLLRFLTDLGCDVKISVSAPHAKTRGHLVLA